MAKSAPLYLVVFGRKGEPNYRIEGVFTTAGEANGAVVSHPHRNSQITRKSDRARVVEIDPGILAWDLSDAFAKDDDNPFDFGMDEIEAALPRIIAAILSPWK